MTTIEFISTLQQELPLPFEIDNVTNIESNRGSVYIDLRDGSGYFIVVERCEKEN